MVVFLYARVSTLDQDTEMQEKGLKKAYPYCFNNSAAFIF